MPAGDPCSSFPRQWESELTRNHQTPWWRGASDTRQSPGVVHRRPWPWVLLALTVAACTPDYPFDKPGTWSIDQYGDANDANLHTMVANPRDLVVGSGAGTSLGAEASPPVSRLYSGKRQPLPALNTLDVNVIPMEQPPAPSGDNAGQ